MIMGMVLFLSLVIIMLAFAVGFFYIVAYLLEFVNNGSSVKAISLEDQG